MFPNYHCLQWSAIVTLRVVFSIVTSSDPAVQFSLFITLPDDRFLGLGSKRTESIHFFNLILVFLFNNLAASPSSSARTSATTNTGISRSAGGNATTTVADGEQRTPKRLLLPLCEDNCARRNKTGRFIIIGRSSDEAYV